MRILSRLLFIPQFAIVLSCGQMDMESDVADVKRYKPHEDLEELFHDVQMARIFPDSKTFPDCRPEESPEIILDRYRTEREKADFDLAEFVDQSFLPPRSIAVDTSYKYPTSMEDHIAGFWDYLVREPDDVAQYSSLVPLPYSYVVPGGRFREVYYWDSYFTMQGLASSNRWDLIRNMLENFAYLIDTIGFIPNGNRVYYLGRSQPPFFSSMVEIYMEGVGIDSAKMYLPQLEKEYDFWMDGADKLTVENPEFRRVVKLEEGFLNRYWDEFPKPRPESYAEDVELALNLNPDDQQVLYRNIRAACESGWDFSSRWFEDNKNLSTIITTQIIPVDLNSLLLHLESTIALLHEETGNVETANHFYSRANQRAELIKKYLWDDEVGYYQDFNFRKSRFTGRLSLAGMYPFYYDIADIGQMQRASVIIRDKFLYEGGFVSTLSDTKQQWDKPNGWPPLQWVTVVSLLKYDQLDLGLKGARNWVNLNERVYQNTHRMMEKYNVIDMTLEAGGGEYQTQDGFGWTNGVAYAMIQLLKSTEISNQ